MGVITDMLREHGYAEWDGERGSMIGASYDWRLMPHQLESRDEFFTGIMEQTHRMVEKDPDRRPAVVIGFSLGCRMAKYFLHFCHTSKGAEWMANHIAHFVPLGGTHPNCPNAPSREEVLCVRSLAGGRAANEGGHGRWLIRPTRYCSDHTAYGSILTCSKQICFLANPKCCGSCEVSL